MLADKPTERGEFQLLRLLLDFDGVFEEYDDVGVGSFRPHGAEVGADLRRGRRDFERPGPHARVGAPRAQPFEQRMRQCRRRSSSAARPSSERADWFSSRGSIVAVDDDDAGAHPLNDRTVDAFEIGHFGRARSAT